MQTQQSSTMQWIPAYQILDSNERGFVMGGSEAYYQLMAERLAELSDRMKKSGRYGKQPGHPPKPHPDGKCKAFGCNGTFPYKPGREHCDKHFHGKGISKPPNNATPPELKRELWDLRAYGFCLKEIGAMYGKSYKSISGILCKMRRERAAKKRKYAWGK